MVIGKGLVIRENDSSQQSIQRTDDQAFVFCVSVETNYQSSKDAVV